MELDFIRLLNEERRRRGLQPVVEDPRLSAYNRDVHARVIAERIRTLGFDAGCQHRNDAGPVPRRWIVIGESLACGYRNAASAVNGQLNSPPHRGIILHPDADTVGVGAAEYRPGAYVFSIRPAFTPLPRERIEQMTLEAVQAERARIGGAPFVVNEKLMRAARRIAQRLAAEP
ncbi:MAG: CAP domain-containing protein, partial [Bryobacteraceae bacterium]|nr:CAP domain-containing protein [Bryobacteraceae bacterium]